MTEVQTNSKAKILDCALKLFSEKSYEGTSVAEIADFAGITKPTLYYFFSSKEGLYKSIWQMYSQPFFEKLEKACKYQPFPKVYEKDVFPQLCNIADLYLQLKNLEPVFFNLTAASVFIHSSMQESAEPKLFFEKQLSLLEEFFEQAALSHGTLEGKEKTLARTFISFVYCISADSFDVQAVVKQFLYGIYA